MIDPIEISEKKFEKSKVFGYKTSEVDEFMAQIYKDYDVLYKEKNELEKKVDFLAEKLVEYREQENKLTDVLLEAKKVSDNVVKKAKEKAEQILSDAEQRSSNMKLSLKREVDRQRSVLQQLQKETRDFKNKILLLYKSQVDLIATLPSSEFVNFEEKENDIDSEDLVNISSKSEMVSQKADNMHKTISKDNNKTNTKLKERTFSISLDKNGMPIKVNEGSISDTQNIALKEDIKKISLENKNDLNDKSDDKKSFKYKEPLKFGANYNINSKKNKK